MDQNYIETRKKLFGINPQTVKLGNIEKYGRRISTSTLDANIFNEILGSYSKLPDLEFIFGNEYASDIRKELALIKNHKKEPIINDSKIIRILEQVYSVIDDLDDLDDLGKSLKTDNLIANVYEIAKIISKYQPNIITCDLFDESRNDKKLEIVDPMIYILMINYLIGMDQLLSTAIIPKNIVEYFKIFRLPIYDRYLEEFSLIIIKIYDWQLELAPFKYHEFSLMDSLDRSLDDIQPAIYDDIIPSDSIVIPSNFYRHQEIIQFFLKQHTNYIFRSIINKYYSYFNLLLKLSDANIIFNIMLQMINHHNPYHHENFEDLLIVFSIMAINTFVGGDMTILYEYRQYSDLIHEYKRIFDGELEINSSLIFWKNIANVSLYQLYSNTDFQVLDQNDYILKLHDSNTLMNHEGYPAYIDGSVKREMFYSNTAGPKSTIPSHLYELNGLIYVSSEYGGLSLHDFAKLSKNFTNPDGKYWNMRREIFIFIAYNAIKAVLETSKRYIQHQDLHSGNLILPIFMKNGETIDNAIDRFIDHYIINKRFSQRDPPAIRLLDFEHGCFEIDSILELSEIEKSLETLFFDKDVIKTTNIEADFFDNSDRNIVQSAIENRDIVELLINLYMNPDDEVKIISLPVFDNYDRLEIPKMIPKRPERSASYDNDFIKYLAMGAAELNKKELIVFFIFRELMLYEYEHKNKFIRDNDYYFIVYNNLFMALSLGNSIGDSRSELPSFPEYKNFHFDDMADLNRVSTYQKYILENVNLREIHNNVVFYISKYSQHKDLIEFKYYHIIKFDHEVINDKFIDEIIRLNLTKLGSS